MVDYWSLYSKKVIDHFQHPRNVGEIKNPSGIGRVGSPVCGDIMELQIKVEKKRIKGKIEEIITDAKFRTFGCGAAIATSSMITEMVKEKRLSEALKISNKTVTEALDGLPAIKMHCSALAEDALKAAVKDYKRRGAGERKGESGKVRKWESGKVRNGERKIKKGYKRKN